MINLSIDYLKKHKSKIILLVGPAGSGKTKSLQQISDNGIFPIINLNLELSQRITSSSEEDLDLEKILANLIYAHQNNILLFDNTELLFTRDFNINPIRLLKNQSRKKVIIMAWSGEYDDKDLTYSNPGDEDFRKFSTNDLDEIEIIKMSDLR